MDLRYGLAACAALLWAVTAVLPARAGNVTGEHPGVLLSGQYACTLASRQYTVYSNKGVTRIREHSDTLDLAATQATWANAYLVAGYNPSDFASRNCDAYGYGTAPPVPVPVAMAGPIATSIHLYASSTFIGDGGYDVWLTRSPSLHDYAGMTSSRATTEMMVWVDHPGLGVGDFYGGNRVAHDVHVDGRRWEVLHAGQTPWHPWTYLVFATPSPNGGSFTMRDLHLGALIRWGQAHGYIRGGDTIQAIDAGFEGHERYGGTSVLGYVLTVGRPVVARDRQGVARHRSG